MYPGLHAQSVKCAHKFITTRHAGNWEQECSSQPGSIAGCFQQPSRSKPALFVPALWGGFICLRSFSFHSEETLQRVYTNQKKKKNDVEAMHRFTGVKERKRKERVT
eukprot:1158643-Pelagomonas_calceolata.AAC.5